MDIIYGCSPRRKLSQGGHVRREGVKCLSSVQEESSLVKSHWGIPWEIPLGKTGVRAPCKGANVFLPSGGQVFQGAIALSEAGGQVLQGGSVCSVTTLFSGPRLVEKYTYKGLQKNKG